jgi:photosystem II stability/assembly factor-like uncharacterized protein
VKHTAVSGAASSGHAAQSAGPPAFHPVSVTFVSDHRGWMLGGEGCDGHSCSRSVVLRTDDYGHRWHPVWRSSVHVGEISPVPTDVDGIRFANAEDGWTFGGALYATHDGGHSWTRLHPPGVVTDVEASGGRAYAVITACNTAGQGCEWGRIYTATVGSDRFRPVPGLPRFGRPGGAFSATLALHGPAAYALIRSDPGGDRLAASADGQTWAVRRLPCPRGQLFNPPALAAWSDSGLVVVCSGQPGAGNQKKRLYTSTDAGDHWRLAGSGPFFGYAASVAAATPRTWYLAMMRDGVAVTSDGGAHWRSSLDRDPGDVGFLWVGFTDATHGAAISGYFRSHAAWFTRTGPSGWYRGPR